MQDRIIVVSFVPGMVHSFAQVAKIRKMQWKGKDHQEVPNYISLLNLLTVCNLLKTFVVISYAKTNVTFLGCRKCYISDRHSSESD